MKKNLKFQCIGHSKLAVKKKKCKFQEVFNVNLKCKDVLQSSEEMCRQKTRAKLLLKI